MFELSDTLHISVKQVSDTGLRSVEIKKKTPYLGILSDTCRTSVVGVLDNDACRTPRHA